MPLQQHKNLDKFINQWLSEYKAAGKSIFCRAGCSACCNLAVHATFTEAAEIARQLTPQHVEQVSAYVHRLKNSLSSIGDIKTYLKKHREEIGPCPFLGKNGHCDIYEARPLSCRALLSTRPADWCKVDFSELDQWDKKAFASSLDRDVVAWPTHCVAVTQNLARELEDSILSSMKQQHGFTLSGNLIAMVWLVTSQKLDQETLSLKQLRILLTEEDIDNKLILNLC